jgi:hypothetical protein
MSQTDPTPFKPFADVPERNTGDNLLRTAQQHHVQLSFLADTKCNIIITVSSIVLTMALGRLGDVSLRASAIILIVFSLLALLTAILAVLPKFKPHKLKGDTLPEGFNLLFFAHFSALDLDRFRSELAQQMQSDGSAYDAMARDLYSLGTYLASHKYPYLRLSYLFFLSGFVIAAMVQAVMFVIHL